MMTGTALMEFVKTNSDMPKDQLMKMAGYSFETDDGKTRYKQNEFMNALLAAQGVVLTPPKTSKGMGRQLSYKTSVMKNGNLTLGKAYFSKAGAEPGSSFNIEISEKKIVLKPAN